MRRSNPPEHRTSRARRGREATCESEQMRALNLSILPRVDRESEGRSSSVSERSERKPPTCRPCTNSGPPPEAYRTAPTHAALRPHRAARPRWRPQTFASSTPPRAPLASLTTQQFTPQCQMLGSLLDAATSAPEFVPERSLNLDLARNSIHCDRQASEGSKSSSSKNTALRANLGTYKPPNSRLVRGTIALSRSFGVLRCAR